MLFFFRISQAVNLAKITSLDVQGTSSELPDCKDNADNADESDDEGPKLKKAKGCSQGPKNNVESAEEVLLNIEMYRTKTVSAVNEALEIAKIEENIEEADVKVTYDELKKTYSVSARCLLCDQHVTLSKTEYSVSAGNYKRHISKKPHLQTSRRLKGKTAKVSMKPESNSETTKQISSNIEAYCIKTVSVVNTALETLEYEEKVNENDVRVIYDENQKQYTISVRCFICHQHVSMSKTAYSVSASNYKRHLAMNVHKQPTENPPVKKEDKHKKRKILSATKVMVKLKNNISESEQIQSNLKTFATKTVSVLNDFLETTDIEKRIDESHVNVSFDDSKKSYSISAKCMICDQPLTISKTMYSVSSSHYKRHVMKHFAKVSEVPEKERAVFEAKPVVLKIRKPSLKKAKVIPDNVVEIEEFFEVEEIEESSSKIETYVQMTILEVNKVLTSKATGEEIDKSHVKVLYDKSKNFYSISVRCLDCDQQLFLNKTSDSVSAFNYELHFTRKHLDENQMKESPANQPKKAKNKVSVKNKKISRDRDYEESDKVSDKMDAFYFKAVWAVNHVLVEANIDKQIDDTHIKTKYNKRNDHYSILACCLLCYKYITLSKTKYAVSANNFKRHITSEHVGPKKKKKQKSTETGFDFVDIQSNESSSQ